MNKIAENLKKFFQANDIAIIVNTTTNIPLLCLKPEFEERNDGMVLIKFESLNERGGNSVLIKSILEKTAPNTIYVEFEDGNVLMIQAISLLNYNHYIKPNYTNSPDFSSLEELKKYIKKQI